jgi:hypothetical protein
VLGVDVIDGVDGAQPTIFAVAFPMSGVLHPAPFAAARKLDAPSNNTMMMFFD